jgi:hypothetical protein
LIQKHDTKEPNTVHDKRLLARRYDTLAPTSRGMVAIVKKAIHLAAEQSNKLKCTPQSGDVS